jgi:hypothetical protein
MWAGNVSTVRETRKTSRMLVGKPILKQSLGISKGKLQNNIKMALRDIGCEVGRSMDLAQRLALISALLNLGLNFQRVNN